MSARARGRAAVYTRISNDPEGRRLGVERQREDCISLARRRGHTVVEVYEDNDVGASTRSATKRRPRFDAMLGDARAGRIDVIISYTTSRLTRRPREHEDLIELAERFGVRFLHVASPEFDLNTADGRNIARILASNNTAESERIAERVSAAAGQRARSGSFHGGRVAFGFEQVRQVVAGHERVVAWQVRPDHAAWITEAARRVLAGETLYGVCSDWNRQGRRTGNGAVWRSFTLKRALTSPAVAGLRQHEGHLYKAVWPAILDREVWDRLHTEVFSVAGRGPVRCGRGAAGRTGFDQESVSR